MQYKFHAYGHPNILATHKTTLEFTKDSELALKGDCIIGVNCDFELNEIKKLIKNAKSSKVTITIETEDKKIKEIIKAEINPDFNDEREMVMRKTDFFSERTFAVRADKAACNLRKGLVEFLHKNSSKIIISIKSIDF